MPLMSEKQKEIIVTDGSQENRKTAYSKEAKFDDAFHLPTRFAGLNKLVLRDMNGTNTSPTFYLYSKDKISEFLKNPYTNEKNIF